MLVHCLDGPECMFPDPYEQKVYSTEAIFDSIDIQGIICCDNLLLEVALCESLTNRQLHPDTALS